MTPQESEAALDALFAALVSWHRIMLAFALLMGLEGPALLVIAHTKRRPWYEQLLAATPAAAFFGIVTAAAGVQNTYDYWQSYVRFQVAYYPTDFAQLSYQDYQDMSRAVADSTRLGWTLYALTTALLIVGWILLLRWLPQHGSQRTSHSVTTAAREVWMRWRPRLQHAAAFEALRVAAESDELEITTEPIDQRRT